MMFQSVLVLRFRNLCGRFHFNFAVDDITTIHINSHAYMINEAA